MIGGVDALGNDAFELLLGGHPERAFAVADRMRAESEVLWRMRQQLLQQLLAFQQADPRQVAAFEVGQIEQHVDQRQLRLAGQGLLQPVEVAVTAAVQRDEFTVQPRRMQSERFQRLHDVGQAVVP